MNYKLVGQLLGKVLLVECILMVPSLIVSLIYNEGDYSAFLLTMLVLLLVGTPLSLIKNKGSKLFARDGIMIVALSWILLSGFGALPFVFSGQIPSFIDAFFESSSGFTTTGSSILRNVELLTHGIVFWRSFTHWFGGMGVLVFTLALIPSMSGRTLHIMRAESPGPSPGKLVPKIADTSKILYAIYFIMTLLCVMALLITGMPLFDSLIHALGAAGTGGFSNKAQSVGYYNNLGAEIVLSISMLLFGVNFIVFFQLVKGKFRDILHNEEIRLYFIVVASSMLFIAIKITNQVGSFWIALRQSSFTVATIITTTGYAITDHNLWPVFAKVVLIIIMFMGGCAGSTAGGITQIRVLVLIKAIRRTFSQLCHPRSIRAIKVDGKTVEEEKVMEIAMFFFCYITFIGIAMLIIGFIDNVDFETLFSSVLATTSNIGPGLGKVGPAGSFADYSPISKLIFSFCMIAGRLELYPMLLLFKLSSWRKTRD